MVAVLVAVLAAASGVGAPERVAVIPFRGDGGAERLEAVEGAVAVMTQAVSDYDLVNRYEIDAIAGLNWIPAPCRDFVCAATVAGKLAVDWVLAGELQDGAGGTTLRLSVIDRERVRGTSDGPIGKAPEIDPDAIERLVRAAFGIPQSRGNLRYGRIRVRAKKGGKIFLDGRDTGFGSPHLLGRIDAGKHVVEVRYQGTSGRKEVVVERGATVLVDVSLTQDLIVPGRLMVDADVPGSTLLLDGEPVGTVPQNIELAPGRYTVRIEAAALAPAERVVAVRSGAPTVVNVVVPKWSPQQAALALAYRGYGFRCRPGSAGAAAGEVCGRRGTARSDALVGPVVRYDYRYDATWAARTTLGLLLDARRRDVVAQSPPAGTVSPLFAVGWEWRRSIHQVWRWLGLRVEGYAMGELELTWQGDASPSHYALLAGGGLRLPWLFVEGTAGYQLGPDGSDGDYRVESRPVRWGLSAGRELGF